MDDPRISTTPVPRRAPGRPRDPAVDGRVLDAALLQYAEHGWAGFTIDTVARRAGVGKSTIYLRWSDREDLLHAAVAAAHPSAEAADTGSLGGDLTDLAVNLTRFYLDPAGWASLRVAVDAVTTAELEEFREETLASHRAVATAVIERALARGELVSGGDPRAIIECLYGAVTMQVLAEQRGDAPATDAEIEDRVRPVVEMLVRAAGGRSG